MKTSPIIAFCCLILELLVNKSSAQPGSLDVTFNPGSGANGSFPCAVDCMALQTNGQIIIGGSFTTFNGSPSIRVARLNSDGSLDGTFVVQADNVVSAIALQPNGKIVIGGDFYSLNGVANLAHVAQLRSDGSVDTSFSPDQGNPSYPRGYINAVAAQQDGKVLAGGNYYSTGHGSIFNLIRFATNGTLDATFNTTNHAVLNVSALAVQSSGQVILGMSQVNAAGSCLERLNTDGSVDTNFLGVVTGNAGNANLVNSIVMLPDDSFFIAGAFTSVNGYSRNGVARINADGNTATTFSPGTGANYGAYCTAVQADGKVLVGGSFWTFNGVTRNGIVRLNEDGTVDNGFNPGRGVYTGSYPNSPIVCMASQPDGKTLIGGQFTQFNSTNINYIARLNSDFSSTTLNLLSPQIYFGMNLSGVVSNTYRIEYTSKLNTPSLWNPLFNVMLQTNPQFILDPNPASGNRFYRAVALP